MKILIAALCACAAVAFPAAAADGLPDAAAQKELRDQLRTDRKTVIEHNMSLTDAEAKKFWPVYEAFQKELSPIQTRYNRAMLDYINADSGITNTNARRLVDQLTQADESESKVRRAYVAKFSKALGAKKAARYYQVESKIRAMERYDQAAAIPLVR
jgi:Spy/CpxP family protein refolding chaperone